MQLQTIIDIAPPDRRISMEETVFVLGSCFADNMGAKLSAAGMKVCVNPFGTLYNPASIAGAVQRLDSARAFDAAECVEMGAGAGLVCSFEHHTSFARSDTLTFLAEANAALSEASKLWKLSSTVIITLGTAHCWLHEGIVVANCLKRPGYEFTREMMSVESVGEVLTSLVESHPDKKFIFTVSPIRHMGEGAHLNQVSKSTLLLGVEQALSRGGAYYFPAYEIVLDELRDYRFFTEDMTHPTAQTIQYIWERFKAWAFSGSDLAAIEEAEKAFRRSQHRPLR